MFNKADLLLYLCTDRILALGRPIEEAVQQAIAGGTTMIQLREKEAETREFYEIALRIRQITTAAGVPLVINDRLDIALAVQADGLHIGQSDMPLPVARRLVGNSMFIGVSASTVEQAIEAESQGADYLGVGAVFPTGSKADVGAAIGLAGLREIAAAVSIPLVAIGGVNVNNASEMMGQGASGISVISAILSQPDMAAASRALRGALA